MVSKLDIIEKRRIYSWSVKVEFIINSTARINDLVGSNTTLLWCQDYLLTLESMKIHPQLEDAGATGYRLIVEATETAADAESLGVRLAYSLLSVAIEKNWGLALSWPDSPLPCRVIDRTASTGITMQGFGSVSSPISISEFVTKIESSFVDHSEVPYSLLLSMELCASSRFESNERSKLIMLVSAFESLAEQRDLSNLIAPLITDLKGMVRDFQVEDEKSRESFEVLKKSLIGQIEQLKRESVMQAIKRFMKKAGLDDEECNFVDSAYKARSAIVHDGRRVPELGIINSKLNSLLKKIYLSNFFTSH